MTVGDLFRIELSGGGLANAFDSVTGFNDGFRIDVDDDDGFSGAAVLPPIPLLLLLFVVVIVDVGFALFAVEAIRQFMCVSLLVLV